MGAVAVLLVLLGAGRPTPTVFDLDRVGHTAPALTLTLTDGRPLALGDLHGTPVYVFLFASWCEPCAVAMPWIRGAYAAYGDRVRFVGIDVLDTPAAAAAFVRAQHLPFDVAIVNKSAIDAVVDDDARLAGGTKYEIPADYLIDASGTVRAAWHGLPVNDTGDPIDVLPERFTQAGFTARAP